MTTDPKEAKSVLIVDGDIVSRHAIAEYLRNCGYFVIEASGADEAYVALGEPSVSIDIVLLAVMGMDADDGFKLANWINANRPDLVVKLMGSAETTARTAAEMCDNGPHLRRPYEPEMVVAYIKRMRDKLVNR